MKAHRWTGSSTRRSPARSYAAPRCRYSKTSRPTPRVGGWVGEWVSGWTLGREGGRTGGCIRVGVSVDGSSRGAAMLLSERLTSISSSASDSCRERLTVSDCTAEKKSAMPLLAGRPLSEERGDDGDPRPLGDPQLNMVGCLTREPAAPPVQRQVDGDGDGKEPNGLLLQSAPHAQRTPRKLRSALTRCAHRHSSAYSLSKHVLAPCCSCTSYS